MSDADVNDELTEEVRRKMLRRDELFRRWAERRKRLKKVEERRQTFANHFGVRPMKLSRHNLIRLLNKTGEPPERILELRGLLDLLGMKHCCGTPLDWLWWRLGPRRDEVEERTAMYCGWSSLRRSNWRGIARIIPAQSF